VHDVSASGQTVYVEPALTLDSNNRLQTLLREAQREEERILLQLSAMVRAARAELAGTRRSWPYSTCARRSPALPGRSMRLSHNWRSNRCSS